MQAVESINKRGYLKSENGQNSKTFCPWERTAFLRIWNSLFGQAKFHARETREAGDMVARHSPIGYSFMLRLCLIDPLFHIIVIDCQYSNS